jgi:hypothetical protein
VENLERPSSSNPYVTVLDAKLRTFERHPWSLAGGGAGQLASAISAGAVRPLAAKVERIGFFGDTHADEAFFLPETVALRNRLDLK